MTPKPQYLFEIKELIATYGVETISKILGTTVRAVGYWTTESGNKAPSYAPLLPVFNFEE